MSGNTINWDPWLDDIERSLEMMGPAIEVLKTNSSDMKSIEDMKVVLHSVKGLMDSVGLKTSTQTVFQIEENVHQEMDSLSGETISQLEKVFARLSDLVKTIQKNKPSADGILDLDKSSGFEAILVTFGKEYHIEIEVKAEKSLRSARALSILNSIKRFSVIKESTPAEEDLYLDANFDFLILEVTSRDHLEDIQKRISTLPSVGNVLVEEVAAKEEVTDTIEGLDQSITIRVPLINIRAVENGLATLSTHVEALKSEVISTKGIEELVGIERAFERIQGDLRKMRKVPLDSITSSLPVMVKRLSKEVGKDAELLVQGRFVTLDRALANYLVDPITQIIRNSISHGIEPMKDRRKARKPPVGRLIINASLERDKIRIKVSDDGKGIDKEALLAKAKELGINKGKNVSDQEVFNLIFERGISTATADGLSGRGVGMFGAKERLSQIGGSITVESTPEKGTTFIIEFSDPDALSKNLIFNINKGTYAIPSSEVEEIIIIKPKELVFQSNTKAEYYYKNKLLPVTVMKNLMGNDTDIRKDKDSKILLVCRGKTSLIGILVDNLLDERLVNIRPLNPLLQSYELFNGTLTGREREVILVINPASIK
ncbi:MAG: ATP-binding protein [Candidatus Heimdallarchaeota archaeon]|nr:ATP-binding protein [Candidatus Heimdallarchaeota archaeon]MDH5647252.1 ATP-binding protein [Candidatus Heimdallarchaeota archaeon]